MELPTYTSIWRIEKRLYKLYDFRLPMPLPVGQIVVFMAITVPYVLLLTLLGLPFSHTLFWLYVLPPGVLTWLATRPVLESKRLPELVISQARYLGEPSVWCRMAPLAEKDDITVTGRVWRRGPGRPALASSATAERPAITQAGRPPTGRAGQRVIPALAAGQTAPAAGQTAPATGQVAPAVSRAAGRVRVPATGVAGRGRAPVTARGRSHQGPVPGAASAPRSAPARPAWPATGPAPAAPAPVRVPAPAPAPSPGPVRPPASPGPVRPPAVERALSGLPGQHSPNRRYHVVAVPGGAEPGWPDPDKRDRTRAVQPIDGSRLVAVLGCTVGAGQTVTTLIVAELLAGLRGEPVAALDLNPGPASLGELAAPEPPISASSLLAATAQVDGPRQTAPRSWPFSRRHGGAGRLDVVAPSVHGDGSLALTDLEYRRLFDTVAARYPLGLADPGAAAVGRVLAAADQLVLVAPASPDAGRSLAMTTEWLAGHGYGALTANCIAVLNGLSKRSMPHAEQAELVVRGRCRAIVRVPWDDHLAGLQAGQGVPDSASQAGEPSRLQQLRPLVQQAYTALAGVLVASLASRQPLRRAAR